jgi:hypothetical protein
MKRTLLVFLLAGAMMAAAYGSAATLNVNGGTIQAGEDLSLTCTSSANVLGWGLEAGVNDDAVTSVRIAVANNCVGNAIFVDITTNDNNATATASGSLDPIPAAGNCTGAPAGSVCVRVTFPAIEPEDLTDIHIWLEGPNS